LDSVDAAKLNMTLTGMATALEGRGDQLGQFFTQWDNYLTELDPHLTALEADLGYSPQVLGTYADAAPHLLRTGANFAVTGASLVAKADDLDAFLRGVVTAASSAEAFLAAVESPLKEFNGQWLPVTALGAAYSPELGCLIRSLHEHKEVYNKVFAFGGDRAVEVSAGFLPSMAPYKMAKNRPKLVRGTGPACYPVATLKQPSIPHFNFDDGTAGIYSDTGKSPAGAPKDPLGLYLNAFNDWFGETGVGTLIKGLSKGAHQ
jgi:phospholipid/cholesterol/gamma-HCH transport system substrate-binding protein